MKNLSKRAVLATSEFIPKHKKTGQINNHYYQVVNFANTIHAVCNIKYVSSYFFNDSCTMIHAYDPYLCASGHLAQFISSPFVPEFCEKLRARCRRRTGRCRWGCGGWTADRADRDGKVSERDNETTARWLASLTLSSRRRFWQLRYHLPPPPAAAAAAAVTSDTATHRAANLITEPRILNPPATKRLEICRCTVPSKAANSATRKLEYGPYPRKLVHCCPVSLPRNREWLKWRGAIRGDESS